MKKLMRNALALALSFSMVFGGNIGVLANDNVPKTEETVLADAVESAPVEEAASEVSAVKAEDSSNIIEVNQGFSIHVGVNDGNETYLNEFVAKKQTVIMMKIPGSDDMDQAKAEEAVKNYKIEVKAVNNGQEAGNNELSADGGSFSVQQAYTKDSEVAAGYYAVANFPEGPDKGTYNIHWKDGDNEIATNNGVVFYETEKLNILVVPVNAYWGEVGTGGDWSFPEDAKPASNTAYKCSESTYTGLDGSEKNWSSLIGELKTYLLDVYPVADINFEEGKEVEAGSAEYDMITADGQKKLWEEVCKLQAKDKETGKDKYDLILAFVTYRQDKGGGQGFTYGKPTNIITYKDKDMFPTVAHEIAHCYKVGDEYDGGSLYYSADGAANLPPNGYKGTDYASGEDKKAVETTAAGDYWKSPKQYKEANNKTNIDENGLGTIVYGSLHPYSLSDKKFISWKKEGETIYPTISYMGSGYKGVDGYYFSSSVIWDYLLKQFIVKEKKEEPQEEQPQEEQKSEALTNVDVFKANAAYLESLDSIEEAGASKISMNSIINEDDLYYDDNWHFGESRMVEVSGWLYKDEDGSIKVDMDPMFSYDGDLEYMDFEEVEKIKTPYTFAAVDANGQIIKIKDEDGEEVQAAKEFSGRFFIPENTKSVNFTERSFSFDTAYPEGTADLVIFPGNKGEYSADKVIWSATKNGVYLESKKGWKPVDLTEELDYELVYADVNSSTAEVEWEIYRGDDYYDGKSKDLYTEVYYCPEGDEGEIYYVACSDDEDWEEGYISIDTSNTEDGYGYTKDAYVWIKTTNGVNAVDVYSDMNDVSVNNAEVTLTGGGVKYNKKTDSYSVDYTGSAITPNTKVKIYDAQAGRYISLVKDIDYMLTYKDNVNAGTASVIVEGLGIYAGRTTKAFTINKKKIDIVPNEIPDIEYTADVDGAIEPWLSAFDKKGNQLTFNKDFTVQYSEDGKNFAKISLNTIVKEAPAKGTSKKIFVKFVGKGNYTGKANKTTSFEICAPGDRKSISGNNVQITLKKESTQYTGKPIKMKATVTVDGKKLSTKEYKIAYFNNKEIGTAKVYILGKHEYYGVASKTFEITPKQVKTLSVTGIKNQTYTGNAIKSLPIVVKAGNIVLKEGVDYKVTISGNTVDVTTKDIKKNPDASKGQPYVQIELIDNGKVSPKVVWGSKVKVEKQKIVKKFNILPAKLNNTASVAVTLKDAKSISANVVMDGSISWNMTKATFEKSANKVKVKPYTFIIKGPDDADHAVLSANADVTKAIVVSAVGKNIDMADLDIKVSKTKSGKIGKITIKPKKGCTKYKGTRTVKFILNPPVEKVSANSVN